jgi:hypothetical protein
MSDMSGIDFEHRVDRKCRMASSAGADLRSQDRPYDVR